MDFLNLKEETMNLINQKDSDCIHVQSHISENLSNDMQKKSENDSQNKKTKKKKTNRCFACRKKIGIMIFNCKCSDNMFCSSCVLPEKHLCTYNFKDDKEALKKKLVKITNRKVPVI